MAKGSRPTGVDKRLRAAADANVAWRSYQYNNPGDIFGARSVHDAISSDSFELLAGEALYKAARNNNLDVNYSDVSGKVWFGTTADGGTRYDFKGDEYALSSKGDDPNRRWIVNEMQKDKERDKIVKQKRFKTADAAVKYVNKRIQNEAEVVPF